MGDMDEFGKCRELTRSKLNTAHGFNNAGAVEQTLIPEELGTAKPECSNIPPPHV